MSPQDTMTPAEMAAWQASQRKATRGRAIQTVTVNLPLYAYEAVQEQKFRLRAEDDENYSLSETLEFLIWQGLAAVERRAK